MKRTLKIAYIALAITGALTVAFAALLALNANQADFEAHFADRIAHHAEYRDNYGHGSHGEHGTRGGLVLLGAAGCFFLYRKHKGDSLAKDALTELAELYGTGKITRQEFLERKAVLEGDAL